MHVRLCILLMLASAASAQGQVSPSRPDALGRGSVAERTLEPSGSHDYVFRLTRGMSVLLTVEQLGVDVVVEVRNPDDRLLQAVDGPTGRSGEEVVEIFADRSGMYTLRVRPYDAGEPEGRYRLTVVELRDARATASLLATRARARDSAAIWLRERATPLGTTLDREIPSLDRLARGARVIGLGEATHGSRELADLRFAVTRYLVQRHAVRLIAVEYSISRLAVLNTWVLGGRVDEAELRRALEAGWIGRRTLRELVEWLRSWNAAHPGEAVRLAGVDPQENADARQLLERIMPRAYGPRGIAGLDSAFGDMAAADSQTWVFGNSEVSRSTHRTFIEVVARLEVDAPLLTRQFGEDTVEAIRAAARQMMQFADFNGDEAGTRSRDWYMAANTLRAFEALPEGSRAVFWAHNAHVTVPATPRTSGAFLRKALGCGYRALATSFGEGGVVAQRPNDLEDRLAVSILPSAPPETIDGVLGLVNPAGAVVTWACEPRPDNVPPWLRSAQPLHWVGGLFAPGSLPSEAFRPFRLVDEFDGIFYVPKVTADQIFNDRPMIPARRR